MIAVVDYAKGNLRSVQKGIEVAGGQDVRIVTTPEEIKAASAVVLPGVGAFADASQAMTETGQMDAVREQIQAGVPFLGICLGMHLLFDAGTEHAVEGQPLPQGLGIIPGIVERMPATDAAGTNYKVPHIGWNSVQFVEGCATPLLTDVAEGEHFYFTHSYIAPESAYTQATTTHASTFPCFVDMDGTCFGIQFHPEKSSDAGIKVLRNFVSRIQE